MDASRPAVWNAAMSGLDPARATPAAKAPTRIRQTADKTLRAAVFEEILVQLAEEGTS